MPSPRLCPLFAVDLSPEEWSEMTEWAEEFVGAELSRHEVYVISTSTLGRFRVLDLKIRAFIRATGVPQRLERIVGAISCLLHDGSL